MSQRTRRGFGSAAARHEIGFHNSNTYAQTYGAAALAAARRGFCDYAHRKLRNALFNAGAAEAEAYAAGHNPHPEYRRTVRVVNEADEATTACYRVRPSPLLPVNTQAVMLDAIMEHASGGESEIAGELARKLRSRRKK